MDRRGEMPPPPQTVTSAPWAKQSIGSMPLPMAPTRAPWARPTADQTVAMDEERPSGSGQAGATDVNGKAVQAHKAITSRADIDRFLNSEAGKDFMAFISALNDSVRGKVLSDPCAISPACHSLLEVLTELDNWISEFPPAQHQARYGNPAYRIWHARLTEESQRLIQKVLPENMPATMELAGYLCDSFGNATRIDYGTGHETTFVALLYCLSKLGVFAAEDRQALVTHVFLAYLQLMRRLQTTYWLEPAGSHGVWGLDDYCFMPFLWGSAQLIGSRSVRPDSIHDPKLLNMHAGEYLYMEAIHFITRVKKGPMGEHSPMLTDISAVPTWEKINSGMLKMYRAEVLEKVPIMQHFLFGSIIRFPASKR
eukprot:jgi/Chlat1/8578/Chrsp82S00655